MALERLKFQLQSESPLILHNGQTADPLNKYSKLLKQISSKRAKTDADFEEMARIEWYASLYLDKSRVCLPSEVIEASLINASRKLRLGKQAQAGLFVTDNAILDFDGSDLTIDNLWERDQNRFAVSARVQSSRIIRTRFRVDQWQAKIEVAFDNKLFNLQQVFDLSEIAGSQIGVGDWRPKFGRFVAAPL